ncbi:hypothetical protein ID0178_00700 [Helicobacter pylori]
MKPFSPLRSQLKFPQKSAFFKRLSLNLVSSFSLTNIKNAKKDFTSKPPKEREFKKKENFKRKALKKVQKKRKLKKENSKERDFKESFKKRKALKKEKK